MVDKSYSNAELVEIIQEALARRPGRAARGTLADGFDLHTAFYALWNVLWHSRAEASPVDRRMGYDAYWAAVFRQQRQYMEAFPVLEADAVAILRAALAGPFTTIPKLGGNFHIRRGRDSGIEVITDNGILAGRDIVLQRVDKHPGRRPRVSQELIDELDREACATLAADRKPLMKDARAALIQQALANEGHHLAAGTIKNKLTAKRP